MNSQPFTYCGPNGLLFGVNRDRGTAWRFSSDDPAARAVERIPTHNAKDGTSQVYALDAGRLWASADGGLSWHGSAASSSRGESEQLWRWPTSMPAQSMFCL